MTTGERLDSISTVNNTTALNHLMNIETSAGFCVISEKIDLSEESKDYLDDNKQILVALEDNIDKINLEETSKLDLIDKDLIESLGEEVIDGIC